MNEHPIEGLMTSAMENLKDMVEVNTIIGDPVEAQDGTIIIPVSKVGFGFAAGGSEFSSADGQESGDSSGNQSLPFGGGSGGGVSITPVAFLIMGKHGVKMVHIDQHTHLYEKMIDVAPQAIEKIQQILKDTQRDQQQQDNRTRRQRHKSDRRDRHHDDGDQEYSNYTI